MKGIAALLVLVCPAALVGGCGSGERAQPAKRTTTHAQARPHRVSSSPARALGVPGPARPVPILMYHVIRAPFANSPYPALYVSKQEFADQMGALRRAGYTAVTLGELWASWHAQGPLPRRAVVVSFDDGYTSHFKNAFPVLRALGWPGVLNLELKNIRPDYGLTDAQVRELVAAGWELDSHTIDHPDLRDVDAAQLTHEVRDSRIELQHRFGVAARFFCFPAGKYDATVIAAVRRAGYVAATTTNPGLAQPALADRFTLNRVRVNGGVTGATLVAQLAALGG